MIRSISVLIFVASLTTATAWSLPHLSEEPALETQIGWNILPSGMLVVAYDLNHNGKPDFFALRVVVKNFFSNETIHQARENFPASLVFYVDYEKDNYFYVTTKQPLFYAIDLNEDGIWDLLYKDVMEDGVNGNERFYDSPSGMFSESMVSAK
ncbi:MAG: hypothetical protein A3K09_04690 [Nitrospinae bacterium RIFCSPLOWO2_12_FULL_47_7]|nr:MAG: hypothetical protein A3K09_04690 [Nitrospinae bacterium RIFCSPLOWO2_12_FULL_47_7]